MPVKIAAALRNAIAEQNGLERDEVEPRLEAKSGGTCHLCDGDLNFAADDIEVDHDVPVDAGGTEELANLNLAHAECNRFKRAQGSRDVRNLLRFRRFYNAAGGALDYSDCLPFFEVAPAASRLKDDGAQVTFQFPDGSEHQVPVYSSSHGGTEYRVCFVRVPIGAVFNDNDVRPRLVKLGHVFLIASDLNTNPLHEAPACRPEPDGQGHRLLMFDGQHKALANWLRGETGVVFKVYLNISRGQATTLVNSIQSKIKKLPLTPFELAAKLSDEYSDRLADYEARVGSETASEEGFVNQLPHAERAAAKRAIEAAVLKQIADDPTILLASIVEMRGKRLPFPWKITETAFQNKLLKDLAHTAPLPAASYKGADMQAARVRERENIVRCLNMLFEKVYSGLDDNSSHNERERARRMSYQVSLKYIASLIRKIVNNRTMPTTEVMAFVESSPTEAQWSAISSAIDRLVGHTVWTAAVDSSPQMTAVHDAMRTNQNISNAMVAVGLTPAYCLAI